MSKEIIFIKRRKGKVIYKLTPVFFVLDAYNYGFYKVERLDGKKSLGNGMTKFIDRNYIETRFWVKANAVDIAKSKL